MRSPKLGRSTSPAPAPQAAENAPLLPKRVPGPGPAKLKVPDWAPLGEDEADAPVAVASAPAPAVAAAPAPAAVSLAGEAQPVPAPTPIATPTFALPDGDDSRESPLPPPPPPHSDEPRTEDDVTVERLLSSALRQLDAQGVVLVRSLGISPNLHRHAGEVEDTTALTLHDLVADAGRSVATGAIVRGTALDVLAAPVSLPDGTLFGSLVAFAEAPSATLAQHGTVAIELLATIVADTLHVGEVRRHERAAARARTERALFADAMSIQYQAQVDLASGAVIGYEALARFDDGEGTATPDVWFREAHDLGLGAKLEARAVEQALAVVPTLPGHLDISVNVSAAALGSPEVYDALCQAPAHRLIVELTDEHETDIDELVAEVQRLRGRGIRISMDDLGAGYADLQRVMRLRPDVLKLDRGLVSDVNDNPAKAAMVTATTILAGRLGAMLVAEGVETMAEAFTLRVLGVPAGQGWHYGRPIASHELAAAAADATAPATTPWS